MKIVIAIALTSLLVGCGENKTERTAQLSNQPAVAIPEVILDPKTSDCRDIFKYTTDGRIRDLNSYALRVNEASVPEKSEYEKTDAYKQRLKLWRQKNEKLLLAELNKFGKDGLLRYSIEREQKYDADKELLSVTSEGKLRRVSGSSYELNFGEWGTNQLSEPMKGYFVTTMTSEKYRVIFKDAPSISKSLSNGRISYSKKMSPMDARNLEIGFSFVGYPVSPYYKRARESLSYDIKLFQVNEKFDLIIGLRCIFTFDKKKNELLEVFEIPTP